jgi:ferredoxin
MSIQVDPNLLDEIKAYGTVNIESCYNCGNCTAVCALTTEEDNFPRLLIRYAQLGLKEKLVGSKELWLCYNCGECSETCPRQAEPAAYMMAARNYAIANYDIFGVGKFLFSKPLAGSITLVLLSIVLGLFMYTNRGEMTIEEVKLFEFLPYEFIHIFGLAAIVFVGLIGLITIINMLVQIARVNNLTPSSFLQAGPNKWGRAFWEAVFVQALGQKRYRQDCEEQKSEHPWYLSKWFVHATTLWGFLGLLGATTLDYLLDILGIKATGTFMPLWHPIRLLGTIAGISMVYGVSILMVKRWQRTDKAHSNSNFSDWSFLILLWLAGMTGFAVEVSLYLPPAAWGYWALIVHVAISMELLLMLPFTKFAHAMLRTVALFVHALKPVPIVQLSEQQVGTD